MTKITELIKKLDMEINLKVFLASFIIMFIVSFLLKSGLKPPVIKNPLPKELNILQPFIPQKEEGKHFKLLEDKPNTYELKKENNQAVFTTKEFDKAKAYGVIDFETGVILAEKNFSSRLPIASLTKVMTAVVTLDLADPKETCSISKNAAKQDPTHIALTANQKLTIEELLNASLLTSANDATEALKDCIDQKYKEPTFIKAMNYKANFLGLKNSHFTNVKGFDNPQHFSSVEDLTILSHYALTNYPLISEIVKKDKEVLLANSFHKKFKLNNWNGLIGVYPGAMGLKIGNTDKAGKTTIVVAQREGKKILVILLGASSVIERDLWAADLLDLGFKKTLALPPIQVTQNQLQEKYKTWRI